MADSHFFHELSSMDDLSDYGYSQRSVAAFDTVDPHFHLRDYAHDDGRKISRSDLGISSRGDYTFNMRNHMDSGLIKDDVINESGEDEDSSSDEFKKEESKSSSNARMWDKIKKKQEKLKAKMEEEIGTVFWPRRESVVEEIRRRPHPLADAWKRENAQKLLDVKGTRASF